MGFIDWSDKYTVRNKELDEHHQCLFGIVNDLHKAIIDKHNIIPPNTQIGIDPQADRKQFEVTPRGIVVVPKNYFKP